MKTRTILLTLLAFMGSMTFAAQSHMLPMAQRFGLELTFGFWRGSASNMITSNGVRAEVSAGALVGGLQFSHWVQQNLAITVGASLLSGKISTSVSLLSVNQHVSSVAPVLFGVKYYPFESGDEDQVRPYLSAAAGLYVGSEESNTLLALESHSETALGGRLSAGVDFFLSNHFKLGVNAGYNVMGDFTAPIGGRRNYNGGELSVGVGYIF